MIAKGININRGKLRTQIKMRKHQTAALLKYMRKMQEVIVDHN